MKTGMISFTHNDSLKQFMWTFDSPNKISSDGLPKKHYIERAVMGHLNVNFNSNLRQLSHREILEEFQVTSISYSPFTIREKA